MKRKYLLSNGILGIILMFACQLCFAINDSIVKLSVEEIDNNISTSKINYWLKKTTSQNPHPLIKGKKVSFKYALQINTSPIKIKIFSIK